MKSKMNQPLLQFWFFTAKLLGSSQMAWKLYLSWKLRTTMRRSGRWIKQCHNDCERQADIHTSTSAAYLLSLVTWWAVYWDEGGQRGSVGEHFGLLSERLLELLRGWMRGGVTSLVSLGTSESRWELWKMITSAAKQVIRHRQFATCTDCDW